MRVQVPPPAPHLLGSHLPGTQLASPARWAGLSAQSSGGSGARALETTFCYLKAIGGKQTACGRSGHVAEITLQPIRQSANPMRHIVANLAVRIRVGLPRRFSELTVFYARLYIGVRRIDEPAQLCGVCGRSRSQLYMAHELAGALQQARRIPQRCAVKEPHIYV